MKSIDRLALERAANEVSEVIRGPGGAVGIVKDGEVILRRSWGYADPKKHLPVTPSIRFPICSISKQFTCGILLGLNRDLEAFDAILECYLPLMETTRPSVRQLCNNQSGLRDYWALTVLHGADAEGVFRKEDARLLFACMRSTHFSPGENYSYSNGNYRILSDLIEEFTGRSLGELYRERIFTPAGMATAELIPDTSVPADGMVGHEGNDKVGFFPATNRIFWTGDAGISASLDDMLAWECFIDQTRDDGSAIYRCLSEPQTFSDGSRAPYGYGLAHDLIDDMPTTGHGGALRGFRTCRLHCASERISVVVLFNHEGDAHGTAKRLMRVAVGLPEEIQEAVPVDPDWKGQFIDPDTGLLLTLLPDHNGLDVSFATSSERLSFDGKDRARSPSMTLVRRGSEVDFRRWRENLHGTAIRVGGELRRDIAGRYYAREVDGFITIVEANETFSGCFEGYLGTGEMTPLYPVAEDIWILPCRRSMDAPAPGDWTVRVQRDGGGSVIGLTIGCWLARNIGYVRTSP